MPRFLLPSVLLLLSGARALELSGRVTDSIGTGQRNIQVVHLASGLSTTTDRDGAWRLSSGAVGAKPRSPGGEVCWTGRTLRLDLPGSARVEASVLDARGRVRGGFPTSMFEAGAHRIDLGALPKGTPLWLMARVDGREFVLEEGAREGLVSRTTLATRQAATEAPDRLAYLEQGDTIAIDTLRSAQDTGLVRRLYLVGLTAQTRLDPRIALDSVVIWAYDAGRGRLRRVRSDSDPRYDTQAGRIRMADDPSGRAPQGRFWARVYGNGGGVFHRTVGISDTASFRMPGSTHWTPYFRQSNALPVGDIVGSAAVRPGSAVHTFRFLPARSDEQIVAYEWDVGGSGFRPGSDSIGVSFTAAGKHTLQVRTTDDEGNQAVTRFRIQASAARRKVVASVVPDTVTPGDVIEMAWGPDTAVSVDTVIWNVEGSNRDTTVGKGPGHQFSYAVLGTDSLPVGSRTSRRFAVNRRMVDGSQAWRFANVEVVNDLPAVNISLSKSSTADTTVLLLFASDRGEIVSKEWSTDGLVWQDATGRTELQLPAAAAAVVTLRVRDEDGNTTETTWKAPR